MPTEASVESWLFSPTSQDHLIALTDDSIWYVARAPDVKAKKAQLEDDGEAQTILSDGALTIPFASLERINADAHRSDLSLHYARPNASYRILTLVVGDKRMRDCIVEALRRRLGADWELQHDQLTRARAVGAPLFLLALATLVTFATLRFVEWLLGNVPAARYAILIVGGLMVLILAVWTVSMLRTPPYLMILRRRESPGT